ncbi:hypothetical protein CoNPh8_CDS0103 [Staphylococcus phage S-CoN_Ph8]|nr:hypothetical protein CoNPh8_CDS0103 [Staphylococcus phage S-CoN_Ph8]
MFFYFFIVHSTFTMNTNIFMFVFRNIKIYFIFIISKWFTCIKFF